MTREQAQIRNRKIFRLRGFIRGITTLIPGDIWSKLNSMEKMILIRMETKIPRLLDEAREKNEKTRRRNNSMGK